MSYFLQLIYLNLKELEMKRTNREPIDELRTKNSNLEISLLPYVENTKNL